MTINPHILEAVGRERTADLRRAAAAYQVAAPADQTRPDSQPAKQPQPSVSAHHDLIPAGTEQR